METQLLRAVFSNTLWALILALFAWLAAFRVRRPALAHSLWLLVLIKLITPPLVELPAWSIPQQARAAGTTVVQLSSHAAPISGSDASHSPSLAGAMAAGARDDRFGQDAPAHPVANWRWLILGCLATWAMGSIICLGVASARIARFVLLLRDALPASRELQVEADALAARLGLRQAPVILLLPGPICPMLWPVPPWTPRIVLPTELWGRLAQGEREGLLLHEMAHLLRRDHWVRLLELVATLVYWWNPLAWWARSRLRQAEELCCDAWVTWASPAGNEDYAAALVEAVDFASRTFLDRALQPPLPALASGMGQFQQIKRRLIMIHSGRTYRKAGIGGILCVCAAAMILPLAAVGPGRAADEVAPQAKHAAGDRRHKAAVKGLEWLAAHLEIAGKEAAADPATKNSLGHPAAINSICGLAFLGGGSDLKDGPYHAQLQSCLDAVLDDCQESGLIAHTGQSAAPMYDHGFATLFLAEAFTRTHDVRIKLKLGKAVALLEKSQGAQGGWRYMPVPLDADVSVTACELNGLLAARAAGIMVRPELTKNAVAYIVACQNADGGFNYIRSSNNNSGPARSAAAGATLLHAGDQPKEVDAAFKYIGRVLGDKPMGPIVFSSYTHYYASQFMASAGGEPARALLEKMCERIIDTQQADGSWQTKDVDTRFGTACAVLALEAQDGLLWIDRPVEQAK